MEFEPDSATVIRQRLELLRRADPSFRVDGSHPGSGHGYQLGPVLSEAALAALESRHRVTLPTDLRTFLLEVGDGGAGPGYGLWPVQQTLRGRRIKLARPFAWSTAQAEEAMGRRASGADEYFFLPAAPFVGVMGLCDLGCDQASCLVTGGEQRGTIWFESELGWAPEFRITEAGPVQHSFASWYQEWLDRSMALVG